MTGSASAAFDWICIVTLHSVEHQARIQRGLIAEVNILVLGRNFEQSPAHQPQLGFGQFRQFAHDEKPMTFCCGCHVETRFLGQQTADRVENG